MRRAAITGVGVVSAGGVGREGFWDLVTSGQTATRRISFFDASAYRSQIAAESEFTPEAAGISPDEAQRMDRAAQFAVFCASECLADSGLEASSPPPERVGVSIGSALGSITRMEEEFVAVSNSGRDHLVDHTAASPHLYDYFHPSQLAAEVAWVAGAEGPATVVSTGCTSGLDAVGYASDLIRDGAADVMIAGATEAPITPISLACFDVIKATTNRNDTPETASRPFDVSRNGFVLGEGAAVFVLEEAERARERGAHVYAEIGGYATRSNAYHMTGLKPDGREMAEAIRVALLQAELEPTDVAYINAHGSGTKQNDRHETAAFKLTLGDHAYRVPVSSIKSMIGHSLGAIGSIEIAACALAIDRGVVPPTANLHDPDPECDLDYVPLVAREHVTDVALTVGSGFGGFQSAMVLARQGEALMTGAIVTGLGVIAPSGTGTEAYWSATLSGKNAIVDISRFDASSYPVSLAGEVRDFDAAEQIESRLLPQTDQMTRMALVASDMALADAGVDPAQRDEYGVGVVSTNCYGGWEFGQREMEHLWATGPRTVSVYESFAWFYAVNTGQISIRHRMRGHCGVLVSEQAGGLDAVATARRQVGNGTPLMLTGGMEAPVCPWTLCAQIASGRLSTSPAPADAYRPFDAGASGHVPAEGGAILVVETPESARRRGRRYGEIAGYAATFDPRPGSDRPPGLRRAAELALADAGISPQNVDVVFADASGTPELDRVEAEAIAGVFGPEGVLVTAPKTMTGRMYGGGPPVDVAAALLSLRDQVIPPTINVSNPAPGCELSLVLDQPKEAKVRTALILARGIGGFNSALVLRAA